MNNQFTYINQINNMDYWSLVNMLMTQITPITRKYILDRLCEMNKQLLSQSNNDQHILDNDRLTPLLPLPPLPSIPINSSVPISINTTPNMIYNQNSSNQGNQSNNYNSKLANQGVYDNDDYNSKIYSKTKNSTYTEPLQQYNSKSANQGMYDDNNNNTTNMDNLDKKLQKIKLLREKIINDKKERRRKRQAADENI